MKEKTFSKFDLLRNFDGDMSYRTMSILLKTSDSDGKLIILVLKI